MYNILDYGAIGDGVFLNTTAIQSAIDECNKNGGGTVVIPAGCFLTGTIWLKSNVELHLSHGALLKASSNMEHYNKSGDYPQNFDAPHEGWNGKHLIIALEQENVAITGNGIIEGCADTAYSGPLVVTNNCYYPEGYYCIEEGAPLRPGLLICFVESKHIKVQGITVRKSACWNLFFHGCDYVQISGVTVLGRKQHCNTDGLDIDACSFVTVSDCLIDTGDDAIAIRDVPQYLSDRNKNKKCEYITISNCVLSNSTCAIRFGVGEGEIHHVSVSNLCIARSGEGLTFQTDYMAQGAVNIHDISISNVTGDAVGNPCQVIATGKAKIERVTIDGYKTNCAGQFSFVSPKGLIEDFVLRNVDITDTTGCPLYADIPLNESGLLSFEGARRLVLDNIRIFVKDDYFDKRSNVFSFSETDISSQNITLIHKEKQTKL